MNESTRWVRKMGSQKDQEQKKNGNYFFYDAEENVEATTNCLHI